MYKKILVTGGAGYIGSHIVQNLKQAFGNKVKIVVVDNLANSYKSINPDVLFKNVDITDINNLSEVFSKHKFDFVYHMAALVDARESQKIPFEYYNANVCGTINVLNCMKNYKVKNLVFASSCSVYGNTNGLITEAIAPNPISVYGQTKLICETIIKKFSKEFKVNTTLLRLFNVVGANENGVIGERSKKNTRIVTNACFAAINNVPFVIFGNSHNTKDGTCGRDYVHVDDVSEIATMILLKSKKYADYCEVFNVGSCNLVTNLEIVKEVEKVAYKNIKVNFAEGNIADPSSVVSNVDKLYKLYGWKPTRSSLSNIVKTSWIWFSKVSS